MAIGMMGKNCWIRASLLALKGSRRATLEGLGGFCLCHLEGKLFSWKRPFTAKVGQIRAQGLCWQISILPGGLLGKTLLPYS